MKWVEKYKINANDADLNDTVSASGVLRYMQDTVNCQMEGEGPSYRELLDRVDIATPHIAGYTLQGKQIGTSQAIRAVARFFGLSSLYEFFPTTEIIEYQAVKIDAHDKTQGQIASIIQYNYPIFTDDFMFRLNPDRFSELRADYSYRREFYF